MVLDRVGERVEREDSRSLDHGLELMSLDIVLALLVLEDGFGLVSSTETFLSNVSSFSLQFLVR